MTESTTLTVMFTDMVASTERLAAVGEQTGEVVRRKLFELLRGATSVTGGNEVKNLGDGLMITFPTVRAGLEAAVLMQRRAARYNRQSDDEIHLRIGMSVGDAVPEDGDWFGIAVVEAARLCAEAAGDQVLITDKVHLLADPGGPALLSVGETSLKGLSAPTSIYEVAWDRASPDERTRSLPRRLEIARTSDFVARDQELESLTTIVGQADAGMLQVALICGEPGIGKTTLAAEAAAAARSRGARVLYGRNEEGISTPFQPFVEALGELTSQMPPALLDGHLAAHEGALGRLVPGLAGGAQPQDSHVADPEGERFQLYAAVVDLLERTTENAPLMLIVDDLHWADEPTLEMLRFVLSRQQRAALAFVGTYRDTEQPEQLQAFLADVHREPGAMLLKLKGFDEGAVMKLMERQKGKSLGAADEALARTLRQESAGNPFFIRELLHGVEEGSYGVDEALPHGVREVILRRVRRLGERTGEVLQAASVVGREFEFDLLCRALDADPDELAGQLDTSVNASLLAELPDCAGTFMFPHALVPHALYEQLGPSRRGRLHARVAAALESLCGEDPGARITELARHWGSTLSREDLPKAARYSMAAGEHALEQLAPAEAARWYEQALEQNERRLDTDPAGRCEILICLGGAQALAGLPSHRENLFAAFEDARTRGDRGRAVRAALANGRGVYSSPGQVDTDRVAMLEDALAMVRPVDSTQRAELLARLADELVFGDAPERVRTLSAEALDIVRRLDDPRATIDVVAERAIAIWSPGTLAVRRKEAEEAVHAAGRVGDPLARFHAYRCRTYASICAGDLGRAAGDHAEALALAERTGHPMARWMARVIGSTIATIQGRFIDGDQLAAEAFAIANEGGQPDAQFVYSGQLGQLWFEQGRLPELQPVIAESAKQFPYMPALTAILAATAAEAGDADGARAALARGSEVGFAPPDITWGAVIGPHAIACARIGDRYTARLLRPLLEPHAGQVAYTAANAWLTVDHHLGAIARVDERFDDAEVHLQQAIGMARGMGAPAWLARAQVELARVKIARGGSPATASELLEEARDGAARVGAAGVEGEAAELLLEPERAITA